MKTGNSGRRGPGRRSARGGFRRTWIAGVVLVLLLGALVVARSFGRTTGNATGVPLTDSSQLGPGQAPLAVGTVAPDFDLLTANGQHYRLSSLRGQPVLLDFFAIWCPHCQNVAPIVSKVSTDFTPRGLHVLSILANPYGRAYDTSGGFDQTLATQSDLTWFETTFGVTNPSLVDPSFATVNQYGIQGYPTIYVVDRNGVIQYARSGEVSYATLAGAVSPLLQ